MKSGSLGAPARRLPTRAAMAAARRNAADNRWKLFCAILLGLCFWFAVPYKLPLQLDPNPLAATANEADAFQGNISRQIAMPALLLLCAAALYRLRSRAAFRWSRLALCTAGYLGWAATSLLWSADPALTRKRLLVFLIDAAVAYTLAKLTSLQELAVLGFGCTGVVALLALVAHLILLNDFRPWDPDFRFMGVMTANAQAMNLFVCLACGLVLLLARPGWGKWLIPLLALFACLLFLTRARVGTALFGVTAFMVGRQLLLRQLHPEGRALVLVLLTTFCLPAAMFAIGRSGTGVLSAVFMMGRHDTENTASLSNRAPLWTELSDNVRQSPWLGTGYAAFWSAERVERISLDQGWVVPYAHNTYLDEVLTLGLPGGLLYVATLLGALGLAWKQYRREPAPLHLLPLLLIGWLVLLGMTESMPLAPFLPTLLAYSCIARSLLRPVPGMQDVGFQSVMSWGGVPTRDASRGAASSSLACPGASL